MQPQSNVSPDPSARPVRSLRLHALSVSTRAPPESLVRSSEPAVAGWEFVRHSVPSRTGAIAIPAPGEDVRRCAGVPRQPRNRRGYASKENRCIKGGSRTALRSRGIERLHSTTRVTRKPSTTGTSDMASSYLSPGCHRMAHEISRDAPNSVPGDQLRRKRQEDPPEGQSSPVPSMSLVNSIARLSIIARGSKLASDITPQILRRCIPMFPAS